MIRAVFVLFLFGVISTPSGPAEQNRFPPCWSPPLQENLKKDVWRVRCSTSAPVSFPLRAQSVILCSIVSGAIPGGSGAVLTGITSRTRHDRGKYEEVVLELLWLQRIVSDMHF
ncbi:hypothetical protein EYF80_035344 [Liparis tanakae]|uniref:Secreted protein n=1 Tax=Liparis tanakae TaxID=230148 RepID=A0A4Z2GMJ5_9TELE|nr:hypothetical protein EYF80_035344 [Liparis tanakae]